MPVADGELTKPVRKATATINDLIAKLSGVRKCGDRLWMAKCPCHDDRKPSLSVGVGDKAPVVLKCHAGCEADAILKQLGFEWADFYDQPERSNGHDRIVATYDYCDVQGELLYQCVRFEPKDFRQRRPDRKGGWVWSIKGVDLVLYHLPKLVEADPNEWVIVVEGEKDADRLTKEGFVATTCPMGAGKWGKVDDSVLKGRKVAIIPDADNAGQKHAQDVAQKLYGRAAEIRIVNLPGDRKDASDWIDAGGTADELRTLIVAAEPYAPTTPRQPSTDSDQQAFALTDLGNAERLIHDHGEHLRYTDAMGWLRWTGTHFERDEADAVEQLAKQTVRGMYAEAGRTEDPNERTKLADWELKCESRKRITDMVALAKSEPTVRIKHADLDCDAYLLTVQNGTLDLRTGELRQHDPADLITRCCPVEYLPEAKTPYFDDFIKYIMGGDKELVDFLQRAVGHSLTGDTTERCLFLLFGHGRNGKSTFLHIIREMLGGYALHARAETLLAKRGDSVPCDLARLKGARLVTFSEVDEGRRMFVSRVKEMTGGTDPITARYMRQNEFSFYPEFKPWIATNHKPTINDDTDSIWDRLYTVPFTVRVPDDRVDKGLADKLLAEMPGILAWAVRGCIAWQEAAGLNPPAAVKAANDAYRTEMDSFALWFEDCCEKGHDTMSARGGELRNSYVQWCRDMQMPAMTSKRFGERMTEQFSKVKTGGYITYRGVKLRGER